MKRYIFSIMLAIIVCGVAKAQERDSIVADSQTIYIDQSGKNSLSAEDDGTMLLTLNGMRFSLGGKQRVENAKSQNESDDDSFTYVHKRTRIGVLGLGSPRYNHIALLEVGKNFFVAENYPGYSSEELGKMAFSVENTTYSACNLFELNVVLDRHCRFVYAMSLGLSSEQYSFREKVTLGYEDGRFYPIELDPATKRSKLHANYLHIPMMVDWNIDKNFFISLGVTFDVLISSYLQYRKPRTTIEGTLPLNPVQFGVTGRVGWKRIYGFVNYSPTNFFKASTGVKANKMSAGIGIWF